MDDLPPNSADLPGVLPYERPDGEAAPGRNWLGIIAFISSLMFSPLLWLIVHQQPFKTGQSLHWIQQIVVSIPWLMCPLPGILLGVAALLAAFEFNLRRGLARAAVIISICWFILWGAFIVLLVFTRDIG